MTATRRLDGPLVKPAVSILFALLLVSTSVEARDCPAAYPADFPCLPGGREFDFESVRGALPAGSSRVVMQYAGPPKNRYDEVLASAAALGWTVQSREDAQEMDGTRYRATFKKAERVISISVFGGPGAALLLVVGK